MAKLEELSELLVSEIRDFEVEIKKLEEIQKAKITIDIGEIKKVLTEHEKVMKNQTITVQGVNKQLKDLIKEAKIYPKCAVILFIASLVLNCLIISYLILNTG